MASGGQALLEDVSDQLGGEYVEAQLQVGGRGVLFVSCYASDDEGHSGYSEEYEIWIEPDVHVVFPGRPDSGWFTTVPVTGYVTASAGASGVGSIQCTGATLDTGGLVLPDDSVSVPLSVTQEGVSNVSCTATSVGGLQDSDDTVVKVDPAADPNVYIGEGVRTDPEVPGAFTDDGAPVTSGVVTDANGLGVYVTDAQDPDGVRVSVGVGPGNDLSGKVTLSVCDSTLLLSAGSEAVITCGSVTVRTVIGLAEVVLDGRAIVISIPGGSTARVSDTAEGATVEGVVGVVTATVNGIETEIPAGPGATNLTP